MKILLTKCKLSDIQGYEGFVLIPVEDDIDSLPVEVVATLSWSDKVIRTVKQNSAMQKYWRIMTQKLNDGGWTKKKYYEVKEVDIDWTPESFGEDIWRGIQEAMYQHRKTSKLTTEQVTKVYEVVNNHLGTTCGVSDVFPSMDSLMDLSLGRK